MTIPAALNFCLVLAAARSVMPLPAAIPSFGIPAFRIPASGSTASGLDPRLDDCATCRPGKTCRTHVTHVREELAKLAEGLASKDAAKRATALRSAASLTEDHLNAPSRDVAKVLVAALEDGQLRNRTLAVQLLCEGQDPELAVEAVVRLIGSFESRMFSLVADLQGPKAERGSASDAMELLESTMKEARRLRDDRIVDALAAVLAAFPTEMRGEPVAMATTRSLLDLGTRDAVAAVAKQFQSRPEESRRRAIHMALVGLGRGLELEGMPSFEDNLAKAWPSWVKKNARRLPKKLGKWTGPVDEADGEGGGPE